jgi:hypothetical protein
MWGGASGWKGAWKSDSAWKGDWSWKRDEASASKPSGQSKWQGASRSEGKRQCQFTIGIEEEPTFRVVRKLLGPHGQHVKRVAEASGAKLRLRGRGSGFREGHEQEESSDPLMLCVSAPDSRSYKVAVSLLSEHIEDVYNQYRKACPEKGRDLRINMHEGPREGSY